MKTQIFIGAEAAIRKFAADTSIPPEETLDWLDELREMILEVAYAIQSDLDASGKDSNAA